MQEIRRIQAMIGEHESVQQVRKDLKIVDQRIKFIYNAMYMKENSKLDYKKDSTD